MQAQELIKRFKAAGNVLPAGVSDGDMWEAKKKVSSAIHPDTGDRIPLPFRMSMFMPVNLPVSGGMLLSGPGLSQVFWQWLNQSYNAGFNYANRNASVPIDMVSLGASYGIATVTACGAAYGLGKVVERVQARMMGAGADPSRAPFGVKLLTRGLPWFAVAAAGSANALAMRYKEGLEGITVFDASGTPQGTSVAAGRTCLTQVALTRVVLPIPVLLMPPFVLDALRNTKGLGGLMSRSLGARTAVELTVIAAFLQLALPFAIAVFPQRGEIAATDLEPAFHGRKDASGAEIKSYFYNKGL